MTLDALRLIAGSGRSGTTWLLDAVAEANELRPVFEPLHPDSSDIAQQFGYSYLTREVENEDLARFFAAMAGNTSRSVWTSYRINPRRMRITTGHFRSTSELKTLLRKWLLLARRYWSYRNRERRNSVLVKCIRANLMLDWIQGHTNARILLLMRHPCAVVESQLRFPEVWNPYWLLEKYRNDARLMEGPLRQRSSALERDFSRAQALAAIWCIENIVPALQARENNYQVVFYEELLECPDIEWPRVAEGLGVTAVPRAGLLKQPSQQSSVRLQNRGMDDDGYSRSYASWRTRLSDTDVREIAEVLQAFGIHFYSVSKSRPDTDLFARQFL